MGPCYITTCIRCLGSSVIVEPLIESSNIALAIAFHHQAHGRHIHYRWLIVDDGYCCNSECTSTIIGSCEDHQVTPCCAATITQSVKIIGPNEWVTMIRYHCTPIIVQPCLQDSSLARHVTLNKSILRRCIQRRR